MRAFFNLSLAVLAILTLGGERTFAQSKVVYGGASNPGNISYNYNPQASSTAASSSSSYAGAAYGYNPSARQRASNLVKRPKKSMAGRKYLSVGLSYGGTSTGFTGSCSYSEFGNCEDPGGMGSGQTLNFGIGFFVNSDIRVELSYNSMDGLSYGSNALWLEQYRYSDEEVDFASDIPAYGGEVSANFVLMSVFYSLEDHIGALSKTGIKPYIGAGVGYSFNEVTDLSLNSVNSDSANWGYYDVSVDACQGFEDLNDPTEWICVVDVDHIMTYVGETTKSFAWHVSAGLSYQVSENFYVDLAYRYLNLGKVTTSNHLIDEYTENEAYDNNNNGYIDEDEIGLPAGSVTEFIDVNSESGDIKLQEFIFSVKILF